MGGMLVSLSETERDYYYTNRVLMTYLGNKDGCDIYKDPVSNTFCKCLPGRIENVLYD